jgi:arabinose-5-phosphate isomerase
LDSLASIHRSGPSDARIWAENAQDQNVLDSARQTLTLAARALEQLAGRLDASFCQAASLLASCAGRVVVCGMGKSGHVARKLATTLACSGTPAFFLHPGEAAHGDLGMVTEDDVVILISRSGETAELCWLLPHFLSIGVPIVGIMGSPGSTIARAATVVLDASVEREACPFGRIPTTSALAAMAIGDALSLAVMTRRAVRPEDVARVHPGAPVHPGAAIHPGAPVHAGAPISGFPPAEHPAPAAGSARVRVLGRFGRSG